MKYKSNIQLVKNMHTNTHNKSKTYKRDCLKKKGKNS